jgi:dihydrofolate synthase/folylpolyglutamate synthase
VTHPSPFARLQELRNQSVELGLWQITRLLDRLDHPERDFPAVHVAGTNGKGSVCAMAAAALQRAGHRVGLLTSPHLVDFTERIRVNGEPIREADGAPILEALERSAASDVGDLGPYGGSFFEVTTALALEHFRRSGIDVAVLEVGLGGRLDATNVCCPAVTAITSIDLDHVETLGKDRPTIAVEKAGIVKPGVPLVRGPMADDAAAAIEAVAARRGAPLHDVARDVRTRVLASGWDGLELMIGLPGERDRWARVPLPGRHQADNAAVAAAAARLFDPRDGLVDVLLAGLEDTFWPGRLARVEGNPIRVYDVAHNAAGARALVAALDELGTPEGSVLLFGVLSDKDLAGMAPLLASRFSRAVTCTPPHPVRARSAEESAAALRAAGVDAAAVPDPAAACEEAVRRLDGGWVFVTGSLFTVGAAMRAFGDPADRPRRAGNLAAREG